MALSDSFTSLWGEQNVVITVRHFVYCDWEDKQILEI